MDPPSCGPYTVTVAAWLVKDLAAAESIFFLVDEPPEEEHIPCTLCEQAHALIFLPPTTPPPTEDARAEK